jgi:polyisoprenoid-binding protein YceI
MSDQAGTYSLGPEHGALTVRTGKTGAAAKAGHNLQFEVTGWTGELTIGDDESPSSLSLTVDPTSLRVLEGTGGIQPLGEDDKDNIRQTIDAEVLKREAVAFRSTSVTRTSGGLAIEGELQLRGGSGPLSFDLTLDDDRRLAGSVRFKQTDWEMKPYSALFGTLKVVDEVEVGVDVRLPQG